MESKNFITQAKFATRVSTGFFGVDIEISLGWDMTQRPLPSAHTNLPNELSSHMFDSHSRLNKYLAHFKLDAFVKQLF